MSLKVSWTHCRELTTDGNHDDNSSRNLPYRPLIGQLDVFQLTSALTSDSCRVPRGQMSLEEKLTLQGMCDPLW